MKPRQKTHYSTSSTSTVTYTYKNDSPSPTHATKIPFKVHYHDDQLSLAASRIQAAYKAYVIRKLVKKISAVKEEADNLERIIQRQETVDAVRSSEKEKLRMNEALMGLLLRLDSVPGVDPTVRELRRRVSRRIVGLQEVMDGICGERVVMDGWDDGMLWRDWFGEVEEQVCRERGGDELERFCAQHLGFRCLQRFLHEP